MPAGPTSQDRSIVMVRPKHCNEMQVVYLNGARLQLMWHEMQAQFRHPLFVAMLIGIAVVIILIGPYRADSTGRRNTLDHILFEQPVESFGRCLPSQCFPGARI